MTKSRTIRCDLTGKIAYKSKLIALRAQFPRTKKPVKWQQLSWTMDLKIELRAKKIGSDFKWSVMCVSFYFGILLEFIVLSSKATCIL